MKRVGGGSGSSSGGGGDGDGGRQYSVVSSVVEGVQSVKCKLSLDESMGGQEPQDSSMDDDMGELEHPCFDRSSETETPSPDPAGCGGSRGRYYL